MAASASSSSVARFDRGEIFGRAELTPEGFLRVDANLTRTGVLAYKLADGSTRRELRHPDDVFDAASLDSLKLRPTTNDHPYTEPRGLVTAENAKRLQVGHVGESVKQDGRWVSAPLVVTDGEAVAAIKAGRRQLSCGYTAKLVAESGVFDGQPYDCRQTDIRYNHVAHVDQARVGPEASIRLDAGDAIEIAPATEDHRMSTLVSVNLDGLTYQAAPEVARALDKMRADSATAEAKATAAIDAGKAREDTLQAKLDAANATIADLSKHDSDEVIREKVRARVALESTAKRFLPGDAKLDAMSDGDLRKAVILAAQKDAKLDGKSDAYIEARFDAVVEAHPESNSDEPAPSDETNHDAREGMSQGQMVDAMRNLWKQPAASN